jgi:uncharacterized protein YbjT (DUF2867 family)
MAIVHLAGAWREVRGTGLTFEEEHLHATANVLHAASVWRIDRLVYLGTAGARPGDAERYLDAKGRAEAMVRGAALGWTVFRPAPSYDLRTGKTRVSTEYLKTVAEAIADAIRRDDTARQVYEDFSTERFPWEGTA